MIELQIGRESGTDSPRLAIINEGKTVFSGAPGSVPKSVSRKHCLVRVGDDLSMSIEDVTSDNFMYINGVDCKRKENIRFADVVELGPDHYHLDLEPIVKAFASKQEWHIAHLEKVYDAYNQAKLDNQVRQGKLGAASALPGVLSMASIGLAFVIPEARVVMIVIAALLALLFALVRINNASKNPLKMKRLDEEFRERYVCPNPACNHFLGATPYKELLKNRACPFCKGKFIE